MKKIMFMLCCMWALLGVHAQGIEVYRSVGQAVGSICRSLDLAKGQALTKVPGAITYDQGEVIFDNGTNRVQNGLTWRLPLAKGTSMPFMVEVESRFEAGSDSTPLPNNYSLYLDIHYTDGTCLYGQAYPFSARTSIGWQKGFVAVSPDKPISYVSCYLLFRFRDGRARFRTPVLKTYKEANFACFDTTAIQVVTNLTAPHFLLHDAADDNDGWTTFAHGDTLKGITTAVSATPGNGATYFDVKLVSTSAADRAVTFAYSIPLPPGELVWLDDPRTEVALGQEQQRNTHSVGCGAGGLSRWPFGAVKCGDKIYALGFDPEAPAIFRVTGNGRLRRLFIAFDVGFAAEKRDARVKFVSFTLAGKDGFRGALATYAQLMPEAFRVRIKKHGIWMAFSAISRVQGFEDFGFGIKEGDGEPKWDDAHGILTTHYTEPTSWWMTMRATNGVTMATARAHAAAEAAKATRRHPYARAWQVATYLDEYGEITGHLCDRPWCTGACWNMCPLPGLFGGEYDVKLSSTEFKKRYVGEFPAGVDGEYIDSAECHLPPRCDYNRAHFGASRTPLCWAPGSHRVCVSTALAIYEYVRGAADRVHACGRIMQANGVPMSWPWLFPFVDYGGQETKWIERGEGAWCPMSDRELLYRRALSYGKPYCFLMNVKFENMTDEMIEKYFQRCLAYGIMSSFFSPNASQGHYFTRPELYNRHRPFFKKYGPLQRRISEAGWRPVNTLVAVNKGNVFVEQFGTNYVTVFNSGTKSVTATLRCLKGAGTAKELVTDSTWTFAAGGLLTVEIPPETCRLLTDLPQ